MLWLAQSALVLASKSSVRREVLQAAGIPLEVIPADIDERAIERNQGAAGPGETATMLAREKARAISATKPSRIVLGADQTLALGSKRFSKPASRDAARAQLMMLRGKTHELHSGIAIVHDNAVLFEHCAVARLTMRNFSESFLDAYLEQIGASAMQSVGAYQLEKTGIQLFETIEGDHFTILGMPLLPLMNFLRHCRLLAD